MDFKVKKTNKLTQICTLILFITQEVICNEARNLQNHRNGVLNIKDVAGHWVGMPKSPYTSYTVTANPTTASTTRPTSAPLSVNKITKQKRTKLKKYSNKRRYDDDDYDDDSTGYRETYRNKDKYAYEDDFDYDYKGFDSMYPKSYSQAPYVVRSSKSAPKAMYVNPLLSSGSQTVKAIYAGTPKVATYVVPNTKKYVVERVKSNSVYVPPVSPDLYAAASSSGMRRLDPMDYDDTGGGGSFLNLGPQEGFPPKPVMNKITQPGQRQPCHGPDCHQHHKGLVRFYWRRVVYPPNEGGRGRGRGRFRRPGGRPRNRRRRLRGSARAPSDQKDIYYTEDDEAEETGENANTFDNENNNSNDEEEDEDNEENDSNRQNVWKPGKAYGHDLNEGDNYGDEEQKVYRDKRYAYRKHMRNRYLKNLKNTI